MIQWLRISLNLALNHLQIKLSRVECQKVRMVKREEGMQLVQRSFNIINVFELMGSRVVWRYLKISIVTHKDVVHEWSLLISNVLRGLYEMSSLHWSPTNLRILIRWRVIRYICGCTKYRWNVVVYGRILRRIVW